MCSAVAFESCTSVHMVLPRVRPQVVARDSPARGLRTLTGEGRHRHALTPGNAELPAEKEASGDGSALAAVGTVGTAGG